jgi:phosphohistidine phosphatase
MKRLLLLRHAKALRDRKQDDHDRALAPEGIWAAEAMADHCEKRLRKVDLALCSSAIRAHETLRLFERCLPPSCKTVLDEDLYLADRRTLRDVLREVDDRHRTVLLVGHEPGLSELAHAVGGRNGSDRVLRRLAKGFKTAALLTIDLSIESWEELHWHCGHLHSLKRPRDLRD